MIHIEKGQFIAENPSLKVVSKTGDYDDVALIEFKDVNSEDELVAGAYQAQFVKYGSLVYRFNEVKDLGEEILKIDPESTHSAASYVRMNKELLKQMEGGTLDNTSLQEIQEAEQIVPEEPVVPEVLGEEEVVEEEEEPPVVVPPLNVDVTPTTTPSIITTTSTPSADIPDISVSSTTPAIDIESEPIIEEPVKEENPTTDDTSSTTSEIVAFAKKKVKKTIRKKLGL